MIWLRSFFVFVFCLIITGTVVKIQNDKIARAEAEQAAALHNCVTALLTNVRSVKDIEYCTTLLYYSMEKELKRKRND